MRRLRVLTGSQSPHLSYNFCGEAVAEKTPEQEAYNFLRKISKQTGQSYAKVGEQYPELVGLARRYKYELDTLYRNRLRLDRKRSYAHLETISWFKILDDTTLCNRFMRQGKMKEEYEAIREIRQYYCYVMTKDKAKRELHPDISSMTLGPDPRLREWPSGRIEYNLTYYLVEDRAKYKNRKKRKPRKSRAKVKTDV